MPCQTYTPDEEIAFANKEIDDLTKMLCQILKNLEEKNLLK